MAPKSYVADPGPRPAATARDLAVVDLSMNENRFGASPHAVAAAAERLAQMHLYPDPPSVPLRQAIGRAHGLDPELLVCGNGSEDLLDIIARLYARPGDEVLITAHGFIGFHMFTMRTGATLVQAPDRDMTTDVDQLIQAITPKTRLIYLANPNNPTGTWIDRAALQDLVERVPSDIVLVIDSAYGEFLDDPAYSAGHEFVEARENVAIARTFSKAYGLAALRVGWVHGPAPMIRAMNQVRGLGNVNAAAQAAAIAALADQDHLKRVRERTTGVRTALSEALQRLGCTVWPSATNFVLAALPAGSNRSVDGLIAALLADNIQIRGAADYRIERAFRITVGTEAETEAVIAGISRYLG